MTTETFTKKLSFIQSQRRLIDEKEAKLIKEFSKSIKPPKKQKNTETLAKVNEYIDKRHHL